MLLRENLEKFDLIFSSHHGFMKRSCLANLLEFMAYLRYYVDKGLPVDTNVRHVKFWEGLMSGG